MREIINRGHVKDGLLYIHYRSKFDELLKLLDGSQVLVTIRKLYNKRSTNQNAYYHGVVVEFARMGLDDSTGDQYSHDEAHEVLKIYCNYREIPNRLTGEMTKVPQNTKSLSTVEFEEYLDRCRKWIFEYFNIIVPLPNEQMDMFRPIKIQEEMA